MIDFPMAELMDDDICMLRLERYLHPQGVVCPRCGHTEWRLFRAQEHFPAYRCRASEGYYTLLTGTVFAKTRQGPATLVLVACGIATGEPTACLARARGLSRKQLPTLRQRIQAYVHETALIGVMAGTVFEVAELYQNVEENKHAAARPLCPPRRRAHKRRGRGTYTNDRPPIISIISRHTGEQRFWVCDHADKRTCADLIAQHVPRQSTIL